MIHQDPDAGRGPGMTDPRQGVQGDRVPLPGSRGRALAGRSNGGQGPLLVWGQGGETPLAGFGAEP